ncbi:hypothetical protein KP509_26G022000 [Ceratopteris richardii]|uniref:Uncharacterized protein n=1 Tax=Ceratopteris richardii TaxID=49495 RepID=A0A8T2RL23_CERRI|nr:hypothetical protein KP509_26G022000 [Ceratopteris richardii]
MTSLQNSKCSSSRSFACSIIFSIVMYAPWCLLKIQDDAPMTGASVTALPRDGVQNSTPPHGSTCCACLVFNKVLFFRPSDNLVQCNTCLFSSMMARMTAF